MVMAFRVERKGSYKIWVTREGNITTFNGNKTRNGTPEGVSISLGTATHSQYFADAHSGEPNLRVVSFELSDDFYSVVEYLKKMGPQKERDKGGQLWKSKKWGNGKLSTPSGSDGASLDSWTKKNALTFDADWLPYLEKQYKKGSARVEYEEDSTEHFPAVDADGEDFGELPLSTLREQGLFVNQARLS